MNTCQLWMSTQKALQNNEKQWFQHNSKIAHQTQDLALIQQMMQE